MRTAEELCRQIHQMLESLPVLKDVSSIPFESGLYFFYEDGETSAHGQSGRIVRIGNHPRSQNTLKRRLRMHYSGNKNSSAFRKLLGGAILRSRDPKHPCLQPAPGQGHWEKQEMPTCEKCRPIEAEVSQMLRTRFRFRCVEVKAIDERNSLEKKLIATISLCHVCKPTGDWLGGYAYSTKVRESGLWNSDNVFDKRLLLDGLDLDRLQELVSSTLERAKEKSVT